MLKIKEGYSGYLVKAPSSFPVSVVLDQEAGAEGSLAIISQIIRNSEESWKGEAA